MIEAFYLSLFLASECLVRTHFFERCPSRPRSRHFHPYSKHHVSSPNATLYWRSRNLAWMGGILSRICLLIVEELHQRIKPRCEQRPQGRTQPINPVVSRELPRRNSTPQTPRRVQRASGISRACFKGQHSHTPLIPETPRQTHQQSWQRTTPARFRWGQGMYPWTSRLPTSAPQTPTTP